MLGFEDKLWKAANQLRGNLDSSQYGRAVLGLILCRYLSESPGSSASASNKLDARGETRPSSVNGFQRPGDMNWDAVMRACAGDRLARTIDATLEKIAKANPTLSDALPTDFSELEIDPRRLESLVRLINEIRLDAGGDSETRDILGRVYEYFLGEFARSAGRKGGEFYTPRCVVTLLVEVLEPVSGIVYDPCCGSGGMFVQSEAFSLRHGGRRRSLRLVGQELNPSTYRLARLNLALHHLEADLGSRPSDTFHSDAHPDLRADFVMANPPFNMREWGAREMTNDPRWRFGLPSPSNANYAWIEHIAFHLSEEGRAGIILANGSLTSDSPSDVSIRRNLLESNLIEAVVALPGKLFYSTMIPACIWFLNKNKSNKAPSIQEDQVLFVDARSLGEMVDRTHRQLGDNDIRLIAGTISAWRRGGAGSRYSDVPGFCRAAPLSEITSHHHSLSPAQYVGSAALSEAQSLQSEDSIRELARELDKAIAKQGATLSRIRDALKGLRDR